jgi:hypothetical protein
MKIELNLTKSQLDVVLDQLECLFESHSDYLSPDWAGVPRSAKVADIAVKHADPQVGWDIVHAAEAYRKLVAHWPEQDTEINSPKDEAEQARWFRKHQSKAA